MNATMSTLLTHSAGNCLHKLLKVIAQRLCRSPHYVWNDMRLWRHLLDLGAEELFRGKRGVPKGGKTRFFLPLLRGRSQWRAEHLPAWWWRRSAGEANSQAKRELKQSGIKRRGNYSLGYGRLSATQWGSRLRISGGKSIYVKSTETAAKRTHTTRINGFFCFFFLSLALFSCFSVFDSCDSPPYLFSRNLGKVLSSCL